MAVLVSPFRKAFSESDHPRGQPGNPGQFGPGGAGVKERAGKQRTAHNEASAKLRTARVKSAETGQHPGAAHGSTVTVTPTKQRAFEGEPVPVKTKLSKQETGRVAEAVVLAHLKAAGFADAKPMNLGEPNFPIDMIEDHAPTEVKGGVVSNGRKAQQWRLTFSLEGKAEKAAYAKMSPEQRKQFNKSKIDAIVARKTAVVEARQRETGKKQKPRSVFVIINPDTRTADLYELPGFHARVDWQSDQAKAAYKGSVTYGH